MSSTSAAVSTKPSAVTTDLAALIARLDDTQIVAVTLYGEARGEPIEGLVAVASVIRNRVGKRFGKTFRDVCLAPWQFSCWKPEGGRNNHKRILALVQRLAGGASIEEQPFKQCFYVAFGVVKDFLRSNVEDCDHYHTATLTPRPSWAQTVVPKVQKGHHVFYRLG